MKKILLTMACAGAITVSAFAQLLDEKNVTITMDLQPVLQLSLQGPDQFDFTFDDISEYYAGITKYGANILRVSASVSFDLWAVGLSQTSNFLWDNPVAYQGGGVAAISAIPITALELRQFPGNPSLGSTCNDHATTDNDSYADAFAPLDVTTNVIAAATSNNCIYTQANTTPYLAPEQSATIEEKYIAGGEGTALGGGCSVAGGSYLLEALTGGTPTGAGYFFVMDYRILPGLPAVFPAHESTLASENLSPAGSSNSDADLATTLDALAAGGFANYAAPGVYQMYIKYILVEDQ